MAVFVCDKGCVCVHVHGCGCAMGRVIILVV